MRQAEAADAEEDEAFGADNSGYNLPEELQRREERLQRIRELREELERKKREEQHLKEGQTPIIEDKEQRSFADGDARMMLMKRGEFDSRACLKNRLNAGFVRLVTVVRWHRLLVCSNSLGLPYVVVP